MIPPPPPSPLFPYTTLFRSHPARSPNTRQHSRRRERNNERRPSIRHERSSRSEEHTSELQSLRHLVCRLLLEKKKIINIYSILLGVENDLDLDSVAEIVVIV